MTRFVPEIGEIPIVQQPVLFRQGIVNMPSEGTRLRATAGENVLVGTVYSSDPGSKRLTLEIDALATVSGVTLWVEDGWEFEILDDEIVGHDEFAAVDE